jgi:hypothetical protein
LLARAVTLDEATSELLNEATEHTAAQRWNIAAASTASATAGTGNLINVVLARESRHALAIPASELGAAASPVPDAEPQAEP